MPKLTRIKFYGAPWSLRRLYLEGHSPVALVVWEGVLELARLAGSRVLTPTHEQLREVTGIQRKATISDSLTLLHNAGWLIMQMKTRAEGGTFTSCIRIIVKRGSAISSKKKGKLGTEAPVKEEGVLEKEPLSPAVVEPYLDPNVLPVKDLTYPPELKDFNVPCTLERLKEIRKELKRKQALLTRWKPVDPKLIVAREKAITWCAESLTVAELRDC